MEENGFNRHCVHFCRIAFVRFFFNFHCIFSLTSFLPAVCLLGPFLPLYSFASAFRSQIHLWFYVSPQNLGTAKERTIWCLSFLPWLDLLTRIHLQIHSQNHSLKSCSSGLVPFSMQIVTILKGQISHLIKARVTGCRDMSTKHPCSFSFRNMWFDSM